MQVLNSKGLASHTDPESCVQTSNCLGEALIGERAGRVLSRENFVDFGVLTVFARRKATPRQSISETGVGSTRSETPSMHGNTLSGNRESPCLPVEGEGTTGRSGKSKDGSR